MTKILFLGFRNASCSQMAAAFARAKKPDGTEVFSAGLEAGDVAPMADKVMAEIGLDMAEQESKALQDFVMQDLDIVVALCDDAAGKCPPLPGAPLRVNWSLSDPCTAESSHAGLPDAFRAARDQIRRLVDDLFERGYIAAFGQASSTAHHILENISEGIIAHDTKRHIFYFNRAAEEITGYRREDVLNRDCHEVFSGNFCGAKCLFPEDEVPQLDLVRRQIDITTKDGEKRLVDMSIRGMTNGDDLMTGVLVSFRDLTREHHLARRLGDIQQFSGIVGKDEKMLEVFDLIRDLADTDAPVLVQGDSGTGKELVAAAIHNEGPRADRLFVPVNCGALPEALLESELFGHVKGAFTGAIRDKKGRFELADGGTIFLDEIGDISPAMQVKLLRVLQEGRFERVGSEQTCQVNVRVISATNKDIQAEIAEGRFREDLFYRLSVVPLWLPALRERRNDIPLLVDHTLTRLTTERGKTNVSVSPETLDIMMSYDWPGNVRELQNWLQFALVKCKQDVILPEHLPPVRGGQWVKPAKRRRRRKLDIESVRRALRETDDSKVEAARLLGVSRATLYRFLDDFGLNG